MSNGAGLPPPGKRKEIYKYEAPWTVYSMNWSVRPDRRFRLALGSFIEEYNNKVKHLFINTSYILKMLKQTFSQIVKLQSISKYRLIAI